jgi:hypothetical protein
MPRGAIPAMSCSNQLLCCGKAAKAHELDLGAQRWISGSRCFGVAVADGQVEGGQRQQRIRFLTAVAQDRGDRLQGGQIHRWA